jgi:hypothetical protein
MAGATRSNGWQSRAPRRTICRYGPELALQPELIVHEAVERKDIRPES